jgi:pimeloyl-ACP methyl ester carboxylesterase
MAYMDVPAVKAGRAAAGATPEGAAAPESGAQPTAPGAVTPEAGTAPGDGAMPPPTAAGANIPPPPAAGATLPASAAAPGQPHAAPKPPAAQPSAYASFDELERVETNEPHAGQAASAPAAASAATAQGQTTNNRCAVLLHGKNFTAANWGPTIDFLSRQGFRVIAPDQIGFGKSSKPGTYQYTFAQLAHNTRALLDSLQLTRCSIVGHSMGGMVAVRFALQYPATTERLILVNPIGLEDYSMSVPYRTVDEWFTDELKATPESIREYQRTSYYAGVWRPEYESQIQQIAGFTLHPDYARVAWVNALTYDMIFTQPIVNDLPKLRVPTRLIIGTRDRTALGRKFALPQSGAVMGNYPLLGKHARDAIPGAQLVELPGLGHVPQVEAFDQFSDALLKFLR